MFAKCSAPTFCVQTGVKTGDVVSPLFHVMVGLYACGNNRNFEYTNAARDVVADEPSTNVRSADDWVFSPKQILSRIIFDVGSVCPEVALVGLKLKPRRKKNDH